MMMVMMIMMIMMMMTICRARIYPCCNSTLIALSHTHTHTHKNLTADQAKLRYQDHPEKNPLLCRMGLPEMSVCMGFRATFQLISVRIH